MDEATQYEEKGPQSREKVRDSPVPAVSIPAGTPSYPAITYMQRT